jgi:hypothetical protein
MANRRMFSKTITNSSGFLMMPLSSQALYFHLGMNADDDGFCEHFTIMRMVDAKPDDLKILQAKGLVHVFDDRVLIIKDWKENNFLRSDRYNPSKYLEIYNNDIKNLSESHGIPAVYQRDTQDRLGKDRLGKDRLGKDKKERKFIPPSLEDCMKYSNENKLDIDVQFFYKYFTEGNWIDSNGNKVKNWKQKMLTWGRHTTNQTKEKKTESVEELYGN